MVAENKLSDDKFLERMQQVDEVPGWVMRYGSMKGSPQLKAAMVRIMSHTFVRGPQLDPSCMCILSGCSAAIDSLFYCISDPNAGVLIPAPYYPAFDNDLKAKNSVMPVPFFLNEDEDIAEQLNDAASDAEIKGHPISALLVTNPNNPLGIIYREDTVTACIKWCLENNTHYVSDEIYALSVFDPAANRFTSALSLAADMVASGTAEQASVDTYVHLLYGLSKDWCASGLRIGLLYSQNKALQEALDSLAPFGSISNFVQHVVTEVLSDMDWVDSFIAQNAALLAESYNVLSENLDTASIPHVTARAGMFVWVDLRRWLPTATWQAEAALWQKLCNDAKVILTPGESCHAKEPGFFRVCFAWVPKEALADAVARLKEVLQA